MLKECSNEISPILALIFNESFARGDVPDEWRRANVSPVFKKGEKDDAANYRPMSLTCICCKTLEHILVSNINKHLALDSILADCQGSGSTRPEVNSAPESTRPGVFSERIWYMFCFLYMYNHPD